MTASAPELIAPTAWHTLEFASDVHLSADEPATARAWLGYLATCQADALFILGDLLEVWVGDDSLAQTPPLLAQCVDALRTLSGRCALFFMHGNRDFLVGSALMQACGAQLLADPTVLVLGEQRVLLSHGDALCLDDAGYLAFRQQVRSPAWQAAFLAQPLGERQAVARQLRKQSQQQQSERHARGQGYADVNDAAALESLREQGASLLIHGHTHRPARHELAPGFAREVLSDWDAQALPPRGQVLRLVRTEPPFTLERRTTV